MTEEEKNKNLFEKVKNLCAILNQAGIKDKMGHGNDIEEHDWHPTYHPDSQFLGSICSNKQAFHYLKQNGFIDIGMCWMCGEEPIKNIHTFNTREDKSIKFFICEKDFKEGQLYSAPYKLQPKSSGCYIATVCYGSENSLEVIEFKKFRDNVLSKGLVGTLLIKLYYLMSPSIAIWLKEKHIINRIVRIQILDRILKYIRRKI